MKNLYKFLLASLLCFPLAGCTDKYDDTQLREQVSNLSAQVSDLARKVSDMNLQVVAMKEVLDQWKAGGYIQGIDNSVPGQHTITFLGGKTVVLYDGQTGQTGPAPDITLKEVDGEWFWYLGQTRLGPAAYTPSFSVNDEGELIVTVNGVSTNLGVLRGQSFFKSVVTQDDKVVFTLQDDTSFTIPMAVAFKLLIAETEKTVSAGEVVDFPYTVQHANASTTVDAFAGGAYAVKVEAGKVVVTVPDPCVAGQVLVWAQNGEGLFSMVKLSFTPDGVGPDPEVIIVHVSEDITALPSAGGDVVVDLVSNVALELEEPQVDWVKPVLTKAEYKLTLSVAENTSTQPRETQIHLLRADTRDIVQTIRLVQLGAQSPVSGGFRRLWGKFSTADAPWNSYLTGFNVNADRNVALDENYVYIAEAKPGVKKIWALNLEDGSLARTLPTATVKDAGTFPLCCPRVINLSGEPVLVVSNMTEAAQANDLWLYVYENGIDADPTPIQMSGAYDRMGDTFSFWGAGATNSSDGQGLTKGMLYFDSTNNNGVRIWKTQWTKGSLPTSAQWVQSRYGFDNANTAVGAFWTFPENKDAGVWGGRGTADNPVKSAFGRVKAGAPNLWTAEGNQVDNTECTTIESGYYNNVSAYQFFSFGGKRYVAYAKQVNGADGRLIVLEGEASDSWETIITARKVFYQAAIQEDAQMQDEYGESPKASGHSGMDLAMRMAGGKVYLAVLKQNVGLSVFVME